MVKSNSSSERYNRLNAHFVQYSVIALLVVQSILVSSLSTKTVPGFFPGRVETVAARDNNNFTLQLREHQRVKLSIPETSYLTYSLKSNVTISTLLATADGLQHPNDTLSIQDVIYSQNGTESRNAALLTQGSYQLIFYAYQSRAQVEYFYNISRAKMPDATRYLGESLVLQPRRTHSIPLNFETLGSPSRLTLFGISNRSIYYKVYSRVSNSSVFDSGAVTVTNATSESDVSKDVFEVNLPAGIYSLNLTNLNSSPAIIYVEYRIMPSHVNPYLAKLGRGPAELPQFLAVGLSSFGLYNESGTVTPYAIATDTLVGFVNISSISAYNPNPPPGVGAADASLQLNAVLVIKNLDGSQYEYWVQNVFSFETDSRTVRGVVSLLNVTGSSAQLNDRTIRGRGGVAATSSRNWMGGTYYTSGGPPVTYDLPFAFSVSMSEIVRANRDVWVSIRAGEFQRGGEYFNTNSTIDDVLIKDANAAQAYFLISGKEYVPITSSAFPDQPGLLFDAELVFAGGANGALTSFRSLDATLRLIFHNQTSNTFQLFPSYYGFGTDTLEAAANKRVSFDGENASVVPGAPDYAYLGRSLPISRSTLTPFSFVRTAKQTSDLLPLSIAVGGAVAAIIISGFLFARRKRRMIDAP